MGRFSKNRNGIIQNRKEAKSMSTLINNLLETQKNQRESLSIAGAERVGVKKTKSHVANIYICIMYRRMFIYIVELNGKKVVTQMCHYNLSSHVHGPPAS